MAICGGCGAPVIHARDVGRKLLALDPERPVYVVSTNKDGAHASRAHQGQDKKHPYRYLTVHVCLPKQARRKK